jgi:D-3-phosphoglycerate dehydrogenase
LKGILEPILEDVSVNYVNAPLIAKERGIKVVESKVTSTKDFRSLIEVTVKTPKQTRIVSGTIFGTKNPRIVKIDDFYLEAVPEGTILVIHNQDRPGVVGNVGTLLGKNNVNISRMQLGLGKKGEAIAIYNVDQPAPAPLLEELAKLPNINSVKQVTL